ncbi:MAG: hypothetical protein QOD65_1866 [Gaiellales bacterium]|jgi:signal transduction histidine kinase|nr:hypothetical protein [Gaiellales bacterium]MEA2171277.1 hypothetical protein [Solirubrobacteraceae bacterium]
MWRKSSLSLALPRGQTLPDHQWEARHHGMIVLLWAHVVLLPTVALGYGNSIGHSLFEGSIIATFAVPSTFVRGDRRTMSLFVTFGLLTCSAVLTHIMRGAIEAHFHFFVMVTVLALYEDWVPFLASFGFVLLHHGLGSAFARHSVFGHGGNPWVWAGVHAFFIAALGVANIVNWRAAEQVRDELRKHTTELEHSNAELERFAYVASHDLAEPLRMVTSYLQLIERRVELDPETKQFLNFAVDGAARMRQLMDDLLRYSRAGQAELRREPVESSALVEDTMRNLAVALEEADAQVDVGSLPAINADPSLIGQVFQNLLSNAVKFRDGEPPHVRVSGRDIPGGWEFRVSDNGIGIPPEEAERVFTMFERLHHAEDYDGTGIGLAVCQLIVERHGGQIRVEPVAESRGSTFVFTLSEETVPV